MKPRPFVTPYMSSANERTNASISLMKIYKRLRTIDPTYKPGSLYQARLKNKRAALHIVR